MFKLNKSPLLTLTSILIAIGIIFISISSLSEANSTTGDKFFFLKKQIIWLAIGSFSFYVFSKINLKIIKKKSFILYIISLIALVLVLIPQFSNQALGASRWLNLGFIGIQPSEIFKFTTIIFISYLFSQKDKLNIKNLIIYLALPFFLIVAEPNLSTAILISAIVISMYYLAGGEILPLFTLCSFITILSLLFTVTSPYRFSRLKTLINKNDDTTASYHSSQIIYTISSGGFFGKGFANSDQKYRFLPKISTDSILAVIGEETGFLGLTLILSIYVSLISYLFRLSQKITDPFQSLIISGTACWIAFQSLINISAIVALIPLTGVPLPFISYGGSSLLTLLSALGLIRNIEKKQTHPN